MTLEEVENILEVYSLEEVLEINGLTEADILFFLVQQEFLELPEPLPL